MPLERTSTDLGRRYQAAIVDRLVSGYFLDFEDGRRKTHIPGLGRCQGFRIAVIRAQGELPRPRLLTSAEVDEPIDAFTGSVVGAVAAARSSTLVIVLPEHPNESTNQDQVVVDARRGDHTHRVAIMVKRWAGAWAKRVDSVARQGATAPSGDRDRH